MMSGTATIGSKTIPSTWHCIVTPTATRAATHQAGRRLFQARHVAASATALDNAIRLGFQMNVDSSIAAAETAIRRPAVKPAARPPIARANHQVTPTAATPPAAMKATTPTGSAPVRAAAGANR